MIYESSSWDHDRFGRLFEAAQASRRTRCCSIVWPAKTMRT